MTPPPEPVMIDLYLAGTANGLRASVALEEAGLPYRAHKVDLAKGEHHFQCCIHPWMRMTVQVK